MTAPASHVDPFDLVIFGGTGDLAVRKLLPALYHRYADGQIQPGSRLIGVARDALSDADYHVRVRDAVIKSLGSDLPEETLHGFLHLISYHALDARKDAGWDAFAAAMHASPERVCVFYLATVLKFSYRSANVCANTASITAARASSWKNPLAAT